MVGRMGVDVDVDSGMIAVTALEGAETSTAILPAARHHHHHRKLVRPIFPICADPSIGAAAAHHRPVVGTATSTSRLVEDVTAAGLAGGARHPQ